MNAPILLDTGPLVALLSQQDDYHTWSKTQFKQFQAPLLTCEAVISEAAFLLRHVSGGLSTLLTMLDQGLLTIPFLLAQEAQVIQFQLEKYANVPMSLADACLVRMSEQYPQARVFTLDSDFYIYRKHRHEKILCIIPPERQF